MPYSIYGIESPFVRLPFGRASEKRCPAFQKCRTQGLATLSTESASQILGNLFQLPTLLGFTLQSFHPSRQLQKPFDFCLPSLRSLTKPKGPRAGAPTYHPPGKLFPLLRPELFTRIGTQCSPGHSGLSGILALKPMLQAPSLQHAPHVLRWQLPHGNYPHEPQGITALRTRHFP